VKTPHITLILLLQGKITGVSKGDDGAKLYSGEHTKDEEDGKWITFKGYEKEFNNLRRDQLRIAPNVLDLLSAEASNTPASTTGTDGDAADLCDIFISYSKVYTGQIYSYFVKGCLVNCA
jgi:hypothetical protein